MSPEAVPTLATPALAEWFPSHMNFTGLWRPHSPGVPHWPGPCLGLSFLPHLQEAWVMESKS